MRTGCSCERRQTRQAEGKLNMMFARGTANIAYRRRHVEIPTSYLECCYLKSDLKPSSEFQLARKLEHWKGHNIFANLSSKEYSNMMQLLKQAILSTDLTLHFERRTKFFEHVLSGEFSWAVEEHREVLRSMLMTACDLGAVTRPWEVSKQVAELVTSEFFEQGDRERSELKLTPAAIFDRNRKDELPALQLEWIDGICRPLYQALLKLNRKLKPMVDGINGNREKWQELCLSDQQTRGGSVSSQNTDPGQNTEFSDDAETSDFLEKAEKTAQIKDAEFGSKSDCREVLRCRANKETCHDTANNKTVPGKK